MEVTNILDEGGAAKIANIDYSTELYTVAQNYLKKKLVLVTKLGFSPRKVKRPL